MGMIIREAKAVFVWSIAVCTLRLFLSLLEELSSLRHDLHSDRQSFCFAPSQHGRCWKSAEIIREVLLILSVAAGLLLKIIPDVTTSVGFLFASTWILYPIRDRFGSIPNISIRVCETVMGRISLRELAMIFPIHFLLSTLGVQMLGLFLPHTLEKYAINPITYSETNLWIIDFLREVFVNTIFCVGLLVVPELLKINGIKRGYALLILYPLYSFSVDADLNASTFSPNMLYALRYVNKHEEIPLKQWCHVLGPVIGGVLGGRIMRCAFPDERKQP